MGLSTLFLTNRAGVNKILVMKEKNNYVYMLRCADNSIYIGWTNDLEHRMKAHNSGQGAKYTKSRRPVKLIYYEVFETKHEAMSREVHMKKLTHKQREALAATAVIEQAKSFQSPHGFSTRVGGVSEGIYESLNLGMNRGDEPEKVTENWKRFLSACEIDVPGVVWARQVHGNTVFIVGKEDILPVTTETSPMEADGFVTNEPGVALAVFTADCVPVLLEDTEHGVVGAVHCGWRSTVADIEAQIVEKMKALGADTGNIRIAIGPAIGKCCFEVGEEVVKAVDKLLGYEAAEFYKPRRDKYMLDLRRVVEKRFLQLGIAREHCELVGGCTMCEPSRYWSHRYTNGARGSQASVILCP